jgi:rSAM/selenodomain-associated transferase 1
MSEDEKLIVFVKAPRLGTVKTRIASTVGAARALEIYQSLVGTVLGNLRAITRVELRYTPDDAGDEIQPWLQKGWTIERQGKGDLGERMHRAFTDSLEAGAKRVVIIGSDCPKVDEGDITKAFSALRQNDLVLGPATDGGYWLIGLRAAQKTLFDNMEWSTAKVAAETLSRAKGLEMKSHLLRELADVDTEDDWGKWHAVSYEYRPA